MCLGALDTRLICEKTCAEMMIIMYTYTEEKKFTKEQVQELFLSINWVSGNYPERLYRALMNSSTVLTVWDGERLVGLIRVLDDTAMLAQIHYVIVHPDYQGKGIACAGHSIDPEQRSKGISTSKPVTIEKDVWIGSNSVICGGVTIGEGSVIGAGSVVTKSIPANVVAVGNPCRVLREVREEDRIPMDELAF